LFNILHRVGGGQDREARSAFRCLASLGTEAGEEVSAAAAVSYRLGRNDISTARYCTLVRLIPCAGLDPAGIDDVQSAVRAVLSADKLGAEVLGRTTSTVWALLDFEQVYPRQACMCIVCSHGTSPGVVFRLQSGSVSLRQFLVVAVPLLLHTSLVGAVQEIQQAQAARQREREAGEAGESATVGGALTTASQQEFAEVLNFVRWGHIFCIVNLS
jgi:hypothetical protein